MIQVDLPVLGRAKAWREAARRLASHGIAPEEVDWQGDTLFGGDPMPDADGPRDLRVPKSFVQLSGASSAIPTRRRLPCSIRRFGGIKMTGVRSEIPPIL